MIQGNAGKLLLLRLFEFRKNSRHISKAWSGFPCSAFKMSHWDSKGERKASRRKVAKTHTWTQSWHDVSAEQRKRPHQPSGRERFHSSWKFVVPTRLISSPSQILPGSLEKADKE